MTAIAEMLADVSLFALLDEGERAVLAERLDLIRAKEGDVLFSRGDPGDSLFVLRSGTVELSIKNDTGDKIVLEVARTGDFFGEMSLLDGGPRQATALVVEAIDALVVDRGDLDELFRLRPAAALDMLTAMGKRMRESARLLRHSATRNVNDTAEDTRTKVMKAADWISEFSGSIPFLLIHCVLFFIWIILNVSPLSGSRLGGFDPYPFGLLTMAVSLEAIILSVFVLLSQNRQVARDRVRNDIEYDVNMKAELEIAHLHERVEALEASALSRLERIEKLVSTAVAARGL
jgi:CRP/FNR family cyclic AMP-dependent transcriptional regulator